MNRCPAENEYGHSCSDAEHDGTEHQCACGDLWVEQLADSGLDPLVVARIAMTNLKDALRDIPVHRTTGPDTTAHDMLRRDLDHLETVLANIAAKESYVNEKQQ